MSSTGLDVFDRTVQQTNVLLDELAEELHWEDRKEVYNAFRTVLHVLRDRLPAGEAADLAAQLPMLVQGVMLQEWKPSAGPMKIRSEEEFYEEVRARMPETDGAFDPQRVVRTVLGLLSRKVSEGEIEDIRRALPDDLGGLWPEPGRTGS